MSQQNLMSNLFELRRSLHLNLSVTNNILIASAKDVQLFTYAISRHSHVGMPFLCGLANPTMLTALINLASENY